MEIIAFRVLGGIVNYQLGKIGASRITGSPKFGVMLSIYKPATKTALGVYLPQHFFWKSINVEKVSKFVNKSHAIYAYIITSEELD